MSGSSRSLQSHGIWVTLILHFLSRSSSLFHSVLKKIKFNLYSEPVFLHFLPNCICIVAENKENWILLEHLGILIEVAYGFGF